MAPATKQVLATCWQVVRQVAVLLTCVLVSVASGLYVWRWLARSTSDGGTSLAVPAVTEAAATALKWSDAVTLILTATTVVLAALALILAVAAVVGYAQIKGAAEAVAKETARAVAEPVARETAGPVAARTAEALLNRNRTDGEAAEDFRAAATHEGGPRE